MSRENQRFYAKRQNTKINPGNKPNSQRLRVLAARQRKKTEIAKREEEKARDAKMEQQKAERESAQAAPATKAGLDA